MVQGKRAIHGGKLNQYIKVFLENVNIRQFKETRVVSYSGMGGFEKLYSRKKIPLSLYSVQVSNVKSE